MKDAKRQAHIKYVTGLIPQHDAIAFAFKSSGTVERYVSITNSEGREVGMLDAMVDDQVQSSKGPFEQSDGFGGTFTLTFRSHTTAAINFDATNIEVKDALELLLPIDTVDVAFSTGAAACSGAGVGIAITFKSELGDLPDMTAGVASLQGGAGTVSIAETTKGTKENLACSDRGICDELTGVCKCFKGYSTSDGDGNEGRRGDCGRPNDSAKGDCSKVLC